MKKLRDVFTTEMIRPIVYRCVSRCTIALTLLLLWNRYLNQRGQLRLSDGGFTAGLLFLALAWMAYLRLDGVKFPSFGKPELPKRYHSTRDIVDFVDEHIVSYDELSDEEQLGCDFAVNLISAVIFLIPSLVSILLH